MSDDKRPSNSFKRAVQKGWERFLCPFTVVDQNGHYPYNSIDGFLLRPHYIALVGSYMIMNGVSQKSFLTGLAISTVIHGVNKKFNRAPVKYFVDTRKKAESVSQKIYSDAMKRKNHHLENFENGMLPALMIFTAVGYFINNIPILYAMLFGGLIQNLAGLQQAKKILSMEWSTSDQKPILKENPSKSHAPTLKPAPLNH